MDWNFQNIQKVWENQVPKHPDSDLKFSVGQKIKDKNIFGVVLGVEVFGDDIHEIDKWWGSNDGTPLDDRDNLLIGPVDRRIHGKVDD